MKINRGIRHVIKFDNCTFDIVLFEAVLRKFKAIVLIFSNIREIKTFTGISSSYE